MWLKFLKRAVYSNKLRIFARKNNCRDLFLINIYN